MKLNPATSGAEKVQGHPVIAENLTKQYGRFVAVDRVSFHVKKGECLALLGPNGAGKTTLIKMISCVYPPTSGYLEVMGLDPLRDGRKIKSVLGVIPQENSLDPDLSVMQNLMVYASYFRIPKNTAQARVTKLLEDFGLMRFQRWKIADLSGGLKRRLTIARAFINQPQMLILDEPTTGLDPQARHFIWERLETFKASGLTMILTTHYIEEASRFADRVIILDRGKILTEGSPEVLIKKHVKRFVIEMLRGDGKEEKSMTELARKFNADIEQTAEKTLYYADEGENLLGELARMGLNNIRLRKATLEDVFIKLTGREIRE